MSIDFAAYFSKSPFLQKFHNACKFILILVAVLESLSKKIAANPQPPPFERIGQMKNGLCFESKDISFCVVVFYYHQMKGVQVFLDLPASSSKVSFVF